MTCTACSHSRILPGQKPRQFEEAPAEEHEDSQARAQRFLEESAAPVVVQDMEEFKDILVENGSYDTFMLMVLTRLQPILVYCLHHDPMEVSLCPLLYIFPTPPLMCSFQSSWKVSLTQNQR